MHSATFGKNQTKHFSTNSSYQLTSTVVEAWWFFIFFSHDHDQDETTPTALNNNWDYILCVCCIKEETKHYKLFLTSHYELLCYKLNLLLSLLIKQQKKTGESLTAFHWMRVLTGLTCAELTTEIFTHARGGVRGWLLGSTLANDSCRWSAA